MNWAPRVGLICILLSVVFAGGAFLFRSAPAPNPLRYSDPQEIIGSHILHQGQEFEVHRIKCNDSKEPLAVVGNSDWRGFNENGAFVTGIPYRASTIPLVLEPHECNERNGLNMVPDALPPGRYILEGVDCVTPGLSVCRAWRTEPFEVVP